MPSLSLIVPLLSAGSKEGQRVQTQSWTCRQDGLLHAVSLAYWWSLGEFFSPALKPQLVTHENPPCKQCQEGDREEEFGAAMILWFSKPRHSIVLGPTTPFLLDGEGLNAFSLWLGRRQGVHFHHPFEKIIKHLLRYNWHTKSCTYLTYTTWSVWR